MNDRFEDFLRRHKEKVEFVANVAGLVAIVMIEVLKRTSRR